MMRRRTVIKSLGALGILGLSSGTYVGFRWNLFTSGTDLKALDEASLMLKSLVNIIIPPTDSPGAAECNVHEFVILMVKESADRRSQINFAEGVKDLQSYAVKETGKRFEECTVEEQISIAKVFDTKGRPLPGIFGKAKHKFLGKSFFTVLKQYTSIGYFTSMQGATKALSYVAIPTRYEACVNLSDYPKSWATE